MRFDSEPRLVFLGGGGFFFFFTFVRDRLFRSFLTSLWLFSEVQTAIFRFVSRIYSLCMLGSDYIAFFSLIVDSDSSFEIRLTDYNRLIPHHVLTCGLRIDSERQTYLHNPSFCCQFRCNSHHEAAYGSTLTLSVGCGIVVFCNGFTVVLSFRRDLATFC